MGTIGRLGLLLAFLSRTTAGGAAPVRGGGGASPGRAGSDVRGTGGGGPAAAGTEWVPFPDSRLHLHGLPSFPETAPDLWRLPRSSVGRLPAAVDSQTRFPAGGRIRFRSGTTTLRLRVKADHVSSLENMSPIGVRGIDAYVDGVYWGSAVITVEGEQDLLLFSDAQRELRSITLYLPAFQRLRIVALGLDRGSQVSPPEPFSRPPPIVYYGSSIAQGACASRPGMSYEAILSRRLDIDFVNLGFSGSGKAESEVVELVAGTEACCYVLDLGKSYGEQPVSAYARMLEQLRAKRPGVPIVCVTPIFSTRELYDSSYRELSEHVRGVVEQAVKQRTESGDRDVHLVHGLGLLGPDDTDAFQEGVHPNDLGFLHIAQRLEPTLRRVLSMGR